MAANIYIGSDFILKKEKEGLRVIINDSSRPDLNELFEWGKIEFINNHKCKHGKTTCPVCDYDKDKKGK